MLRVFIVDHYEVVRIGLKQALEKKAQYQVVGESDDIASLPTHVNQLNPDLVVCEVMFPHGSSFRFVRTIMKQNPCLRVLFLTSYELKTITLQARRCGSYGLLSKRQSLSEIMAMIEKVANGCKIFCDPPSLDKLPALYCQLSQREEEVVCCIARGMRVREIALHFGVSQKTVEAHKTNIMKKLDLHSQVALIRWAIEEGLIPPQ